MVAKMDYVEHNTYCFEETDPVANKPPSALSRKESNALKAKKPSVKNGSNLDLMSGDGAVLDSKKSFSFKRVSGPKCKKLSVSSAKASHGRIKRVWKESGVEAERQSR